MPQDRDDGFLLPVYDAIRKYRLISSEDQVLIAVSGGADSVALVHALNRLGFKVGIAHLNHGLRGQESDEDADFVASLSRTLNLPFFTVKHDVFSYRERHGLSLEEAARDVRYAFLYDVAGKNGYNRVATAHHADDNIELVLMNLLRGSGSHGLGGMPFKNHDGRLIRPMLEIGKKTVLSYIHKNGLTFRTDSSNADPAFTRNRVRHHLIPLLEQDFQPNIRDIITRTARIIRDEDEWIESEISRFYTSSLICSEENLMVLDIPKIRHLSHAVLRRVIRRAIHHVKKDLKRITQVHTDAAAELVINPKACVSLDLPGQIRIWKDHDRIVFTRESQPLRSIPAMGKEPVVRFHYHAPLPDLSSQAIIIHETGARLVFSTLLVSGDTPYLMTDPMTVYLDMDRLTFPLTVRNPEKGDRFRPLGMTGSQNVSRYFINNRIKPESRRICPLVVSGSAIAWVCGHRVDDRFKITKNTEKILKIELFLA